MFMLFYIILYNTHVLNISMFKILRIVWAMFSHLIRFKFSLVLFYIVPKLQNFTSTIRKIILKSLFTFLLLLFFSCKNMSNEPNSSIL